MPFGWICLGLVLYLIVQPIIGDDERGEVDGIDDVSLISEGIDETAVISAIIRKEEQSGIKINKNYVWFEKQEIEGNWWCESRLKIQSLITALPSDDAGC